MGGLLDQQNPAPGLRRLAGRAQPGSAAADNQHIGMGVKMLVMVRVRLGRRLAQARCAADDRLVDVLPCDPGKQEGLVIEPGREHRQLVGDPGVQGADVALQAGPVVLAGRGQPIVQLGRCCPLVGLEPGALANAHQGVRLLCARRYDAARAMILEGPPDQPAIVGQQGRSERIALKALQ